MFKSFLLKKIAALLSKLNYLKRWQIILYLFIIAQVLAFIFNYIQSYFWWGYINTDLLFIGTIDAALIVVLLAPILIYLVSQITRFEEYRNYATAQNLVEQKYRRYIENSLDIVTVLDKNGFIKYESPSIEKMLGYNPTELIGRSVFDFVHPDEVEFIYNIFKEKVNEYNATAELEIRFLKKNGLWLTLSTTARNLIHDEIVNGIIVNSRDITEKKLEQKKLAGLLEEKKTLIREIHHRVKNNFQSVSSMLFLQGSMIKDENLKEILNVSRNRIQSLALLHEKLQEAENVSNVNLLNYFSKLIESIGKSYNAEQLNISFEIKIDEKLELETDLSIQLGLVFNELVSNMFKHAFPYNQSGTIQVTFTRTNGINYFTVKDNGVGLPVNFDISKTSSLGLKIVVMISKQIGGELLVTSNKGTEFTVKFPDKK